MRPTRMRRPRRVAVRPALRQQDRQRPTTRARCRRKSRRSRFAASLADGGIREGCAQHGGMSARGRPPVKPRPIRSRRVHCPPKTRGRPGRHSPPPAVRHAAEYYVPTSIHNPMEPYAAECDLRKLNGKLTGLRQDAKGCRTFATSLPRVRNVSPRGVSCQSQSLAVGRTRVAPPQFEVVVWRCWGLEAARVEALEWCRVDAAADDG